MAARPGEETIATLFGDVHYFYAPETTKPQHHRFDKGSYVYLFENASSRRARIEIANQPGRDDQDAFDGYLDYIRLSYSYKQPALVTLTLLSPPTNPHEWHLPTYDPRNENKYHYPLHAIDVYFWTRADALQFVGAARRVLPPQQCEVLDEPPAETTQQQQQQQHQEKGGAGGAAPVMNAVVQRLENVAVSCTGSNASAAPDSSAATYAPIAYNPAAPPAPETIQHREKTPPPPQDPATDPRVMAAAYEQGQGPFSPAPFSPFLYHGHPLASPAFPHHLLQGQPLASPKFAPSHAAAHVPPPPPPPPPPPGAAGFGQGLQQQVPMSPLPPGTPGFYPGSPGFAPNGMQSIHSGVASPQPQHQPQPQPQQQQQQQPPAQAGGYDLHHQGYTPEAALSGKKEGKARLEENAGRLERGVSGMFKKFEKKFG